MAFSLKQIQEIESIFQRLNKKDLNWKIVQSIPSFLDPNTLYFHQVSINPKKYDIYHTDKDRDIAKLDTYNQQFINEKISELKGDFDDLSEHFDTVMTTAYLGIVTPSTTPPATGAYWYRVDTAGTYMGVTVTASDLEGNDVFIDVKDNVATKRMREQKIPSSILSSLMKNYDFKDNFMFWSLNEPNNTATSVSGNILSINTSGASDPAVYQLVTLNEGTYTFSIRLKNTTTASQTVKIGAAGYAKSFTIPSGDFIIITDEIVVDASGSKVVMFNPPPNTTWEIDYFYLLDNNNIFAKNIDNVNAPFFLSKNITITDENNVVSITSPTDTYIFDVRGGYRKLVTNINIDFEEVVYLSSAPDSYIEVDMMKKGSGQTIYLWKERYNAYRTKQRKNLIGTNYYGWSSNHPSLEISEKDNTPFFLSKNITINYQNNVVSITSPIDTYIFDVRGGYRKLVTNININFEEAVYLSLVPDSYVEVDMRKKGTGQTIYLWNERYDAHRIKQRKNLIGINYYGWSPNHPSLEIDKSITSDYKKWFPNKSNVISPFRNYLKPFIQKYFDRTSDVTLVQIGDSISTDLNWTDKRPDANERPPFCTEYNVNSFLEEKLRWKEQKYRRFDYAGVFTETLGGGTSSVKETDDKWGTVGGAFYYPITKVIDGGTNAGISFKLPANNKRLSLIVHSDQLFATQTKVVIAEGNGKVKVWNGSAWVEANNYTTSFQETSNPIVGQIEQFYMDNAQKRLKFRNVDFAEKTITVQNIGAGRFGYWGIEYSPNDYMFTYICACKGSHSIARLQQYETWMVDEFNPDLVLWQMPVLNEALGIDDRGWDSSGFGAKFLNKYNALVGKGYLVLPYILWAATYSEFVDTNGNFLSGLANGKTVSTFADVANIMSVFTSNDYPVINLFNLITETAINKAKEENGNIYSSALVGSGKNGNTFTIDGIHMNKLGSYVVFNLLEPYFNF